MPKPTSAVDPTPVKVVIITLDSHLSGAIERASRILRRDVPGLEVSLHAAAEWTDNPQAVEAAKADIADGDIIFANMLFLDDQIQAVLPALQARRDHCDVMIGAMASGEIMRLTSMGKFSMDGEPKGPMAMLKKLRGSKGKNSGAKQMSVVRGLPKILKWIPGTAQDVRAYFMVLQYWLAGSEENMERLMRFLINRYATGPRAGLAGSLTTPPPKEYPDNGIFHPDLPDKVTDDIRDLDAIARNDGSKGTVGVMVLRSYVLSGDHGHYDGAIRALEARGLKVIPVFAAALDARPAIEEFFLKDGKPVVDAMVSLTGFSLVGGPAYNDARAAETILKQLDVPYVAAHPLEFQSVQEWEQSERGLMPVESTIMVAIPELDGSTGPMVFGGRSAKPGAMGREMASHPERVEMLAARLEKLVALRRSRRAERKVALVMFNFPPNAGNIGTAAYLSVFESAYRTLKEMADQGYTVDLPADVDAFRDAVLHGNASQYGTDANVAQAISADDHVRRERYLSEIEGQWGAAPGRQQTDGRSIFVLGAHFGNVFVGIQPAFGYEGDPMRLLFERGFSPTHAFSAFYRYIRDDFGAHAVLHFGTHGALEFMPGKQTGMSEACWPDRLINDLPNYYLYAANNPSEGAVAKRRAAATLISYLTPPVAHAGLYKGLEELKASIDGWRKLEQGAEAREAEMVETIKAQAEALDLVEADADWSGDVEAHITKLGEDLLEMEYTLIPDGLHVVGEPLGEQARIDMLLSVADASYQERPERAVIEHLVTARDAAGAFKLWRRTEADMSDEQAESRRAMLDKLAQVDAQLSVDTEVDALIHALDAGYVPPAPGGDLLRTPDILPTGRNLHGFDPFRIPSPFALKDGAEQAQRLLATYLEDGGALPSSIAIVMWGTDNLKTEGAAIGQALALIGARPRLDSYGKLCGAELIPLDELGRARIDVVMSLSGIFRDLLPLQTQMLAEACWLAATADEPVELNKVRAHALDYMEKQGCDMETAALRVFSNADGAYGSNVNNLVDSGRWDEGGEIADTFTKRKCFAYGRKGKPVQQEELFKTMLADVDVTYQNLDSVELGVTTIDTYFDTLGGISKAVSQSRGGANVPVYVGDQTQGKGKVRALGDQVALETRTRMLNPKWYEGMLKHGYEGVRQIEEHLTNTMGWSATTGQVDGWVYQQVSETFLLNDEMRRRLAELNPTASAKMVSRLLEAHERNFWNPDEETLERLQQASEELEDQLEGVGLGAAA
ncbi:magnesium chelatase subunit H [Rhodothalassium salexigens]|uniref:magnesium chelatase subunit H n=1 Tax=Rhodothalassium salexigens TaxID=1086 RepID=UPI001F5E08A7|nr:magnesium chelatase subunit H [Rhodothalassium salexigens]MBK5920535.1 magnesium chelatase subunit H [Rhodothalassium salexigens]